MVDITLLVGKLLFLALMYLFILAAVRAGLGTVRGVSPKKAPGPLALVVATGPPEMLGVKVPLSATVTIGRTADSDLTIADDFVSSRHAEVVPGSRGPVLTDLGSTNGTIVNGRTVTRPVALAVGDLVELGTVKLRVERL